jgi:hypothetical protein
MRKFQIIVVDAGLSLRALQTGEPDAAEEALWAAVDILTEVEVEQEEEEDVADDGQRSTGSSRVSGSRAGSRAASRRSTGSKYAPLYSLLYFSVQTPTPSARRQSYNIRKSKSLRIEVNIYRCGVSSQNLPFV